MRLKTGGGERCSIWLWPSPLPSSCFMYVWTHTYRHYFITVVGSWFHFFLCNPDFFLFSSALSCIKSCLSTFFFPTWSVWVCVCMSDRGVRVIISVFLIFKSSVIVDNVSSLYLILNVPGCISRSRVGHMTRAEFNVLSNFFLFEQLISLKHGCPPSMSASKNHSFSGSWGLKRFFTVLFLIEINQRLVRPHKECKRPIWILMWILKWHHTITFFFFMHRLFVTILTS